MMPKILDYTDKDFPSLNSNNRPKNACCIKSTGNFPSDTACSSIFVQQNNITSAKSKSAQNTRKNVLEPYKHKETYSVGIYDAIKKTLNQSAAKHKIHPVKNNTKIEHLSGNPLDADNPTRRKGKIGLPKKPKRISKTKRNVLEVRRNILEAKESVKEICVEEDSIRCNSNMKNEDLWNTLHLIKLSEIKKTLKNLANRESKKNETNVDNIENCDDSIEEDDSSDSEHFIDIRELLKTCKVPIHKILIHNHNFKRYCDNCINKDLNDSTAALISQIVRFQQNKYQRNPVKATADKRYVLGFKQTLKYTRMNKIKLIVCVPDMEESMSNLVEELKLLASAYCIPYVFALTRRKLGSLSHRKVGVCCFGILDYSSAENNFNKVIEVAAIARKEYQTKCSSAESYCYTHLGFILDTNEKEVITEMSLSEDIEEKLSLNSRTKDEGG